MLDLKDVAIEDLLKQCVQVKDVDRKSRRIKGFISTEEEDRDNEAVVEDSLAGAMPRAMKVMSVVYLHQYGGAIGHPEEWSRGVDERGFKGIQCVTKLGTGYQIPTFFGMYGVDDIFAQVEQGHLRAHSIGFRAKRELPEEGSKDPVRLHVTDLYEYSLVVVPSNRGAVIEEVLKSAGLMPNCKECQAKIAKRQEQVRGLGLDQLSTLLDETRDRLKRADRPRRQGLIDLLKDVERSLGG